MKVTLLEGAGLFIYHSPLFVLGQKEFYDLCMT